ncbi:MAG: gamma-glutamyltransferase [Halobacteriovoraceae bacterium]|nr:gamma-glutamyltransferase [Halobacteriovoraceae bacterium]
MRFALKLFILSTLISCSFNKPSKNTFSSNYMIASQGPFATKAGMEMFEKGGNVFDAFAAVSFTISVERPQSTGLGGGGFLTYYKKEMNRPSSIDFREQAPLRASPKMFQDKKGSVIPGKSLNGVFSSGVPGMVAGVLEVHRRFGKLPLKTILAPAIKLASEGFPIYPELSRALNKKSKILEQFPATKKIFFKNGKPLSQGDILQQKDLAKTLRLIALHGKKGFYEGPVAQAIASEMKKQKGLIGKQDLLQYEVKERDVVAGTYRGLTIYSMGPPSSGGIHIIQILNMLEDDLPKMKWSDPQRIHLIANAMQFAFIDRAAYLGDSDFVKVPVRGLLSKKYAKDLRKKIQSHILPAEDIKEGKPFLYESEETTHFSIMDREGNTVSSTQTINGLFGSGMVIPGTGIILNNEMDDFTAKIGAQNLFGAVGGKNNAITPKKRPLSSMSPTIVFKDKRPILALGASGGTRILTCVAQIILNFIEYDMTLDQAMAAPRIHQQWKPHLLEMEEYADAKEELIKRGHVVKKQKSRCKAQAIARFTDKLHGVSDPRYEGMSLGK